MKNPRRLLLPVLSIMLVILVNGGMINRGGVLQKVSHHLHEYQQHLPNEKVYLHLDRNLYLTGDSIWFKAYVFNQHFPISSNLSPTLHVLLMGPDNHLVEENLFLLKSATTHGNIKIPENATEGTHRIVAYTSFMKNFSPEHAFLQEIQIKRMSSGENAISQLMLDIQFEDTIYQAGDKVRAELVAKSLDKQPKAASFNYSVKDESSELLHQGSGMVVSNGQSLLQFEIPEKINAKKLTIQLQASIEETYYHASAFVPFGDELVDFSFFPEGGHAVFNLENKIAFKAVNQYGNPVSVEGWLKDKSGRKLKKIKSFYEGMGFFTHLLEKGQKYYVELEKPYRKIVDFPEIEDTGVLMTVIQNNEEQINVFLSTNSQSSERVSLIMTLNGQVIYSVSGYLNKKATVQVPTRNLGRGIGTITLFNEEEVPVAERLIFINKEKQVNLKLVTNKYIYSPRDKVNLRLEATDDRGKPITGNFSLAVTDAQLDLNKDDELAGLESYLLLASELKGNIPTPGFYFEENDNLRRQALDMLMLTHGWRKYTISEVLAKDWRKVSQPGHQEVIRGTIQRKNNKDLGDAKVNYIAIEGGMLLQQEADDDGNFSIHYPYLEKEGISYLVHGFTEKNKKLKLTLDLGDNDPYIQQVQAMLNEYDKLLHENLRELYAEVQNVVEVKELEDLGKYQLLQEVTVKGEKYKRPVQDPYSKAYTNAETRTVSGEDLQPAYDFFGLLRQVSPAIWSDINQGRVIFGGRNFWNRQRPLAMNNFADQFDSFGGRNVLFIVDGMPFGYNIRQLDFIRKENIEVMTVVRYPFNNFYGGFSSNEGMVFVQTKNIPEDRKTQPDRDFMIVEGYQVKKEFYSPQYDTPESRLLTEPDLRTILFWDPDIQTDKDGVAKVSFYNHDRITRVRIRAEGFTKNQEPVTGNFEYLIDEDTF